MHYFIFPTKRRIITHFNIKIPNKEKAPIEYVYRMEGKCDAPYYALSADYGWEWFNYLRNHESYYSYVDKAKKLLK